jgi:nitroreductase
MELLEVIRLRSSVRAYSQKPVPKELIEKLVDSGRLAPTARGVQPCDFIIIQNKNTLNKISQMAPNAPFIKTAQAAIVVVCQETKYFLEDGCAATENILLAAVDSGLGACWIAGDKKDYAPEIARMLNCPEATKLVSIISIGYPAESHKAHERKKLKDIIHWETF